MDKKIADCLNGNASTEHILPFFWQHGEDHAVLAEEIDAIQNCGVNEFCVESRTHEQFGEEKWWEDFGFLLQEAKSRGMRVWLLDDKRFPSGYANNYLETHPELRSVNLRVKYADFVGPQRGTALVPESLKENERFVAIVAYRRREMGNDLCGEGVSLLPMLSDGLIWWDIPEGVWRVFYIVRTHDTFAPYKKNYINMLSPESCKAMLHAVYEPHYEHFKEYFGSTFVGFFSDEPCFGNDGGNYLSKLGKEDMLIPWDESLPGLIAERSGRPEEEVLRLLPALWHDIAGRTSVLREAYMEAVTEAYSRNFCWLLGDWCRAHGVLYIGHVIEDMNTHQRLGYGAGHYFRSLDGQDMAGIDIVLNQIIPGQTELDHTACVCGKTVDPEFFNYTIAKLGASHSHIQPLKKNRAMCEIYGAFGWAEGVPMMKHLTDHMLVNGINYFVPHAFTPKYPDYDCPPHFFARGMNTQYPMFGQLMGYLQRMTHALTGGVHQAQAAVYYNAEAEWAGGKYMLQQKVCKALIRSQTDFDLIPQDTLCGAAEVQNGRLAVNEETYAVLIVPYSQYLPEKLLNRMEQLAAEGLQVLFIDSYPDFTSEQRPVFGKLAHCGVVSLSALPELMAKRGLRGIVPEKECPSLRFYHIKRDGTDLFMLWNESIFAGFDGMVTLPAQGTAVFYDAWKNKRFAAQQEENRVRVHLAPSGSIVICMGETAEALPMFDYCDAPLTELSLDWSISLRAALEEDFTPYPEGKPGNLARALPKFSGAIRYDAAWTVENAAAVTTLDLGEVGETAEVWVNGEYCGAAVGAPYRFDVSGKLKNGVNALRVEVLNNLAYRERDFISQLLPLPPTGLLGPVCAG